ncbi:FMN-binding negative transcriptional regulator [Isoptericola cucumis]|uniref:FMN-binding negative transcriptional regulator n=1 Tax=Isoptericola cucumis TaxID=1776856 RepID=UPI00320AEB15
MRHTPHYVVDDPEEVRRLVRAHPWATFVSPTSHGLVASHYPVLLDPGPTDAGPSDAGQSDARGSDAGDAVTIVSHFGRPDDELHELGEHEVLVIVQGPHDYVSPSWYAPGELVPTWNHVTAHLYGTPELLSDEENYAMLGRLTDHFEAGRPGGRSLSEDEAGTRRVARGTVGLRMRVERFDARAKLSQNKAPDVVAHVIDQLEGTNPALAREMRRVRGDDAADDAGA